MQHSPRLIPRSLCYAPNVARAVKRALLRGATKAGGGGAEVVCECVHHQDAYNEIVGDGIDINPLKYSEFSDDAIILSGAITITDTCCVLAVGTILAYSTYPVTDFELEQPLGTIVVDQEDETPTGDISMFHYAAWEVLTPGIYTYHLVNRSGATRRVFAAQLKIVAFSCTGPPCACQYHAHAYYEMNGLILDTFSPLGWNAADGATVLSQAITITSTCCVLAVGTIFGRYGYPVTDFELEQPLGTIVVDQEDEVTTMFMRMFHYAAWEVLTPGIYTYHLVNRSGGVAVLHAAQLKIIAVECV